jgi:glutamate-1-semialdehyde 2,1-aminomutase
MDCLAPVGPVYQAGTLSGNPLATAAGLAVLGELSDASYTELEARAAIFAAGLRAAFGDAGVAAQVTQVGTLTGVFFAASPVTDYAQAQQADHERYARFFHAMLDRGVFLAPSGYETLFVSLAHDDETLETTIAAAREAAATIA